MQVVIERGGSKKEELKFDSGPIYIGREIGSKIFLPDLAVSRRHAVLYNQRPNEWVIEDLDSANKTYVNGEEIVKHKLSSGDVITVSDYTITVEISKRKRSAPAISFEDTIAHSNYEVKTITRKLTAEDSPLVRISHQRVGQLRATLADMMHLSDVKPMLDFIVRQTLRHMQAAHCWVGVFEKDGATPFVCNGRKLDTTRLELNNIAVKEQILSAVTENEHVLVPRFVHSMGQDKSLRSAIISTFNLKDGKNGAAYIANSREYERYTIIDLDYLMLVSTALAAKLDHLI